MCNRIIVKSHNCSNQYYFPVTTSETQRSITLFSLEESLVRSDVDMAAECINLIEYLRKYSNSELIGLYPMIQILILQLERIVDIYDVLVLSSSLPFSVHSVIGTKVNVKYRKTSVNHATHINRIHFDTYKGNLVKLA